MSRLLLVRHGATELNRSLRYAGHSNARLSADGHRQVEGLCARLAGERINAVYSSDLQRALATAEGICSGRGIGVVACPELREIDYGGCEGMTFQEIGERYPEVAEQWADSSAELAFPNGESFAGFAERTGAFLNGLDKHSQSETVLIVSHGGTLRVLLCLLLRIGVAHWWRFRLDTGSLSVVETYPQGAIVNLLNDTCHLEDEVE